MYQQTLWAGSDAPVQQASVSTIGDFLEVSGLGILFQVL